MSFVYPVVFWNRKHKADAPKWRIRLNQLHPTITCGRLSFLQRESPHQGNNSMSSWIFLCCWFLVNRSLWMCQQECDNGSLLIHYDAYQCRSPEFSCQVPPPFLEFSIDSFFDWLRFDCNVQPLLAEGSGHSGVVEMSTTRPLRRYKSMNYNSLPSNTTITNGVDIDGTSINLSLLW